MIQIYVQIFGRSNEIVQGRMLHQKVIKVYYYLHSIGKYCIGVVVAQFIAVLFQGLLWIIWLLKFYTIQRQVLICNVLSVASQYRYWIGEMKYEETLISI